MGNEQSKLGEHQTRHQSNPFNFRDEDGNIDHRKYTEYLMRKREEREPSMEEVLASGINDDDEEESEEERTERSAKVKRLDVSLQGDKIHEFDPSVSAWAMLYTQSPMIETDLFHKIFREQFRMPYGYFLSLVEQVKGDDRFSTYLRCDATGDPPVPIDLLVLGAIRVLSNATTFKNLWEVTGISPETHRRFFHRFCDFGRHVLYNQHVFMPTTAEEVQEHMKDYAAAGFHGAFGSSDGIHVASERIPAEETPMHNSHKTHTPCRAFNVTVNHRRRIMHTTLGAPATYNDTSLVRYDELLSKLQNGELLDDAFFDLMYRDDNNQLKVQRYQGAYVLVDNGYAKRPNLMPPCKDSVDDDEIVWSKFLESLRKDVECTFGILRGRWRIFKSAIRLHGLGIIDNIWFTCCALHNILLDIDGRHKEWINGSLSDWEGELGEFDKDEVPAPLMQLHENRNNVVAATTVNDAVVQVEGNAAGTAATATATTTTTTTETNATTTATATTTTVEYDVEYDPDTNLPILGSTNYVGTILMVRTMDFDDFRGRLVEHFHICHEYDMVRWPRENDHVVKTK